MKKWIARIMPFVLCLPMFFTGCQTGPATQPNPFVLVIADAILSGAQIAANAALATGKITPLEFAAIETVLGDADQDIQNGTGLTPQQVQDIERKALAAVTDILIPPPAGAASETKEAVTARKALSKGRVKLHMK